MAVRKVAEEKHNALCTAWRQLVHHMGGVHVVALALGLPQGRVSEYGSPHTGRSPSIATVLEAEAMAGEPFVTAALAATRGLELAQPGAGTGECRKQLAGRVMQEFGDALAAYQLAEADGKLTPSERAHVDRELGELARALARFRAAIREDG